MKNPLTKETLKNNVVLFEIAGFAVVFVLAALLVYCWRVFYYLDVRGVAWLPLTAALGGIGAALWLGVVLVRRFVPGLVGRAVLCILACGLLFVFANPPMQVPDETSHFLRAYRISQGQLDFDAARSYPADVSRLMEAFPGAWVNAHTSLGSRDTENAENADKPAVYDSTGFALKQYGESGTVTGVADGFARYFSGVAAQKATTEPLNLVVLPYLPAAAGMALARLLGLGALGCLYAARVANLLVYALLCGAALRRLKAYQPVFLAVMLLPMGLYMAASVNYDAIALGCYYYLATWFFAEKIDTRGLAGFAAAFLAANIVKPWINLLWLAVLWCIPRRAWQPRCKRWQAAALCLAAVVAVSRLVDWYGVAFQANYGVIGRQMADADMLGQLKFVLGNPLRYLAVLVGTLYENDFFLGQLGVFGALDLPITVVNLLSPLALGLGAVLAVPKPGTLRLRRCAGLGAWALVYAVGALTAIYITWTPVGMVRIIGFQARYLLPIFLPAGAALAGVLGRVVTPQGTAAARGQAALAAFGLFGAMGALLLWQHYFIGPVYTI